MKLQLADSWWSLVLRGVIALLLGLIALAMPGITLGALVIVFAVYALADGVAAVVAAFRASRAHERWAWLLLEGVAGILIAGLTIVWPGITALVLVYLIGAWALITGVLEIAAAIQLRRYIAGEWLLALSGFASILFGLLVMVAPLAGAIAIALWVGVYSIVFGVLLISLGFRLRSWSRHSGMGSSIPSPAH